MNNAATSDADAPRAHGDSWSETLFASASGPFGRALAPDEPVHEHRADAAGGLWAQRLFRGRAAPAAAEDRMQILKSGVAVHEFLLSELNAETLIGRHPDCDIRLEAQGLAMHHACLRRLGGGYVIERLDAGHALLLNQEHLPPGQPARLSDGSEVDLPGYRLHFILPNQPAEARPDGRPTAMPAVPAFRSGIELVSAPPCPLVSRAAETCGRGIAWNDGITELKVVSIIDETPDAKTFRLAGSDPVLFAYRPGQFVTLLLDIDGLEVQRSYSMSSSPSRPHTLELTVKRVPGGLVSNWLCDRLRLGDMLRVKGPAGRFTCFEDPSRRLLFLAAGCGVTPIMSMCRWIVDTAADVDVKLLASFRSPSDIIFRRELEWLCSRHSALQVAVTVTSGRRGRQCWGGLTGRVTPQMITLLAPDYRDRHVFMCGPEPFMQSIREILRVLEFDLANLHSESFGSGRVAQGVTNAAPSLQFTGAMHKVTFRRTGLTVDTDEHTTLLELAEAHGIEIDYSCRSGSCGECEVKCRGEVAFGPECEIDPQQRAAGFVYACSCVAKSDLELEA